MNQYSKFSNNENGTSQSYSITKQCWMPSLQNPYPVNFSQRSLPSHQVFVYYNGKPQLQDSSIVKESVMYPSHEINCNPKNSWERKHTVCSYSKNDAIMYPTTHSYPGPLLQSYIAIPKKMYMY